MSLMHDNILKCYGTTHLDGNICMVLELSSEGALDEVNLTMIAMRAHYMVIKIEMIMRKEEHRIV